MTCLPACGCSSALAVGAGPWDRYEQAIAAAREGRADPAELLAEVARRTAETGHRA